MAKPKLNAPYETPGSYCSTHACAIPQCQARIPKEFLMCHRHWMDVPRALRDGVWRTWRVYAAGTDGAGKPEYLQARQDAIAAVTGRRVVSP